MAVAHNRGETVRLVQFKTIDGDFIRVRADVVGYVAATQKEENVCIIEVNGNHVRIEGAYDDVVLALWPVAVQNGNIYRVNDPL